MRHQGSQSQRFRGLDRLSPLIVRATFAVLLFVPACRDGQESSDADPAPRRRVDAVPKAKPKVDLEGFCDQRFEGAQAKPFELPTLAEGKPPGAKGWRWVNVWATYCQPCIEEMPLIHSWKDRLASGGAGLEVLFVSVDESAEAVEDFRSKHPDVPTGVRIADDEALGPWLQTVGLGEETRLPIHMFVDPDDKLRCIRLGEIGERDYDTVAALVKG